VFELRIFDGDPLLDLFSLFRLASNLLNVVELWYWLLGLLRCLELLILLDDDISFL
jgi:hypothetical protein